MPDVLLFGATGYTGRLVSQALSARGADFIVAGRNHAQLEALAAATGASGIAVAEVGDVPGLAQAAANARVLVSCVGPFSLSLGATAVEAAILAKVNYLDCTGEGGFIQGLIDHYDSPARGAGVAIAPALGFDEVPADVAATLATDDLSAAELVLTYAVKAQTSSGTLRSALDVLSSDAHWIQEGSPVSVRTGQQQRWSPLPAPLGPSRATSFPAAEGHLAPLHLDLAGLKLFIAADNLQRALLRIGDPVLQVARAVPAGRALIDRAMSGLSEGPSETDRHHASWMILAEATSGPKGRNVAISGRDPYGLTAQLLATAALEMASLEYSMRGVVAPAQALPVVRWQEELLRSGASIDVFEP